MEPSPNDHSSQQVLELFRCPRCGQFQEAVCPGFGQHPPSKTLIRLDESLQCIQCGQLVTAITCSCGRVTILTPDILDDPTGRKLTSNRNELEQLSRFQEISKRVMPIMMRLKNVWTDESLITELQAILKDWKSLLDSLPNTYPFVNPDQVRMRIADTKSHVAQWYSARRDSQKTIEYYDLARQDYEALGNREKVQECWESIGRVRLWDESAIDDELQRRQAELETIAKGSLHYIEIMIDLSALYAQAGDDFEAEKVLLAAEEALKSLKLVDDDGRYLPDLLEQKMPGSNDTTFDQQMYQLYALMVQANLIALQAKLYSGLAAVYRERSLEKAVGYLQLALKVGVDQENANFLELQLAFILLKQGIHALEKQSHEQDSMTLADHLLQGAYALEVRSRELNVLEGVITALLLQADIFLATQRDDEAIAVLSRARNELKGSLLHDRGVQVLAKLAEAHTHKQQWRKVSEVCEEGISLVEGYRYKVTSQYMQSAYLTSRIGLYSRGVRAAFELGDNSLMLKRAELSKCRSVLLYQQQTSTMADQQIQMTEQKFQQATEQIAAANPKSEMLNELQHKRRTLWDLMTVQRFQSRAGKSLPEFSLEAIQAALAADEAIIYYYWLDRHTLLIAVIDQKSILPILRFITPEQYTNLQAFANFVMQLTDRPVVSHLDSVRNFSAMLLPEEAAPLLEGKQRLLLSPHRLLHAVPLHALRWIAQYLIEHFAITYIPNLSSLLYTYTPLEQQRILALGIDEYAVPGLILRSLKTAEQEVDDLKRMAEIASIPITALKGPEARMERIRQLAATGELAQCTTLHFATHGFNIDSDTPMESFLFLRDAQLDGLEIANWQLQADVVILGACCSGQRPISGRGMEELPGDELFGLQSAFFTSGAKRILSCLWPVDDAVASSVTRSFHRHMSGGVLPDIALQTALKEFLAVADIDQDGVYYWGPFFLSAMGRPTLTAKEEA